MCTIDLFYIYNTLLFLREKVERVKVRKRREGWKEGKREEGRWKERGRRRG